MQKKLVGELLNNEYEHNLMQNFTSYYKKTLGL